MAMNRIANFLAKPLAIRQLCTFTQLARSNVKICSVLTQQSRVLPRMVVQSSPYSTDSVSDAQISDRVLECIKQYDKLTSTQVTMESRFKEDLSMDSLDHVEMIMLVEDEFGFEIPDSEAEKMTTPQKIVEYIAQKL